MQNNQSPTIDRIRSAVSEISAVVSEVEKLLAAAGVNTLATHEIDQLTSLFGSLAQLALRAITDALGRQVTPESVLKLLPASTPLASPSA